MEPSEILDPESRITYDIDEAFLASEGIKMMINNNFYQAEKLFDKYRDFTPLMHAGSSFMLFMNAMITFEDEKLDLAMKSLKATEKLCQVDENTLFKSISRSFRRKESTTQVLSLQERLQRYVITADCSLYMAILTFVRQGITSYIKSGLLLRKAWKTYEKCYKTVNELNQAKGDDKVVPPTLDDARVIHSVSDTTVFKIAKNNEDNDEEYDDCFEVLPSVDKETSSQSEDTVKELLSAASADDTALSNKASKRSLGNIRSVSSSVLSRNSQNQIFDARTIERLKGAIFFGYGLFNVCLSLIPPRIIKLAQVFGFGGERDVGLRCLKFASNTTDMKAPLARLALLWYHVIVRPFYGLDGADLDVGIAEAEQILEDSNKDYGDSALFLFFRGRICRLHKDLLGSLEAFCRASDLAKDQAAIQQLCCYEKGWCHMISMNWHSAFPEFVTLKQQSRWSQSYYTYLAAITLGASGNLKDAAEQIKLVPQLARKRGSAPELFAVRKANQYKDIILRPHNYVLLILEVIYLWGAMRISVDNQLKQYLIACEQSRETCMSSLQVFMLGILHLHLRDFQLAEQYLKEAIRTSKRSRQDTYMAPYATYELGSLLSGDGQTVVQGKSLLHDAKDNYSGYDLENRLHFRIHSALSRLKQK